MIPSSIYCPTLSCSTLLREKTFEFLLSADALHRILKDLGDRGSARPPRRRLRLESPMSCGSPLCKTNPGNLGAGFAIRQSLSVFHTQPDHQSPFRVQRTDIGNLEILDWIPPDLSGEGLATGTSQPLTQFVDGLLVDRGRLRRLSQDHPISKTDSCTGNQPSYQRNSNQKSSVL
jgi:hypothetical protein